MVLYGKKSMGYSMNDQIINLSAMIFKMPMLRMKEESPFLSKELIISY